MPMSYAIRVGDMHTCPLSTPNPHTGGPVLPPGATTVLIEKMPAARVGDMASCAGPPDAIAKGSASVFIEGKPAARLGDMTAHGGSITLSAKTVVIGG